MKKIKDLITNVFWFLIKLLASLFIFVSNVLSYIYARKKLRNLFYSVLIFILYITILIKISGDSSCNKTLDNKCINDVTQLNPTQVNKIVKPTTIGQIVEAVKTSKGPISIGGGKYSMGGQTAFENSLHIDMRSFNKILRLDTLNKTITVQAGTTWRDIQSAIDPHNLSVKIMQTYANFTVGGAISVNCHGRYIGHGPIISSVREIKIVTVKGDVIVANREVNADIFKAVIGGYGGIGVIAEVTLDLEPNVKVERIVKEVSVEEYNNYFNTVIRDNKNVVFQNGDLYPPDYNEINSVAWMKTDKPVTDKERLTPVDENYWLENNIVEVVSWGSRGKWMRKNILEPIVYWPEKVRWRNKEASYNVLELEPASREKDTYVLQEYFIPVNNIKSFIPKMRAVFQKYDVNVLNVSIRHALPDTESYLSWAPKEVFAFVIYFKQGTDKVSRNIVKQWTLEMTDSILKVNGTWYLPYQPHATVAQFKHAYPGSDKYFAIKNQLDPEQRLTNKLLGKYNPAVTYTCYQERNNINGYYRAEEQTILTVPEWYLVFNPKEYADYLESGKNPSDFPFYKSIDEYWKLYDRSLKLTSAYPANDEYITMLKVIGISITLEYGVKMIYENTIGKLFSYFAEKEISKEEKIIIQAQRAYSDFVYHTAWYEFKFFPWVKKVWSNSEKSNGSVLRKWERILFFTFEYSFKSLYAQLIEWGAKYSYETPVTKIYMTVTCKDSLIQNKDFKVVKKCEDKMILEITRWDAFTQELLNRIDKNIVIEDISGNDEIVVSVIMKQTDQLSDKKAQLLYESRVVSDNQLKRNVYILPVNDLMGFLRKATMSKIMIEHIYDY